MENQIIVRIDPKLKNKASRLAKTEGKNLSKIIRELLESYVKERDIETYIDDLWTRIGNKISEAGYTKKDINKVIRTVRKKWKRL